MTNVFSTALLPIMLMCAGIGDVLTYRIPNWLTGLIAVSFVPLAFFLGMPLDLVTNHLATGAGLLVVGFGLFALGAFGGGDAKLMAAAGLWMGWPVAMQFLVYTAFAGGLLAIAVAAFASTQLELEIRGKSRLRALLDSKPDVPYGLALAVGAILAFPGTWWMTFAS